VTPEQVMMVQASFAELGPHTPDLAARFYERLFATAPSLRTMFSKNPAAQKNLFVSELAMIVHSISRFDAFVARVRDLGARHETYGVTYVHYEIAGRALLEALADTLGPAFTDELHDAWRLAFDLVAETMMQGAADATPLPPKS
jgi:hemoglobin-like flavoprotein